MEHRPSAEPAVCYCVHRSLPLVPVLSQINPLYTLPSCFFKNWSPFLSCNCNITEGSGIGGCLWGQYWGFISKWEEFHWVAKQGTTLFVSVRVMKQTWCTTYCSLSSHNTSACFGLASSTSSGGNDVYMWYLVHVVRLSRMSAVNSDWYMQHVPIITYIHGYLPPDDGILASLKPVDILWLDKLQ
jgi:hypothetical protein